jgi:hypothetical protein
VSESRRLALYVTYGLQIDDLAGVIGEPELKRFGDAPTFGKKDTKMVSKDDV